jgi:hypothetical protein
MVAVWSTGRPDDSFTPWACPCCPSGKMVWFACDLRDGGALIEHKFACGECNEIEHLTVPFARPPEAA